MNQGHIDQLPCAAGASEIRTQRFFTRPLGARIEPEVDDFLDNLQPIAAEIGAGAARDLCALFGGARLYVPRRWRKDLEFNCLGEDIAKHLCRLFGPERIDIPKIPFTPAGLRKFVANLRAQNFSTGAIARELGVSYRTVARFARESNE